MGALAHGGRLAVFRLLIQAGHEGLSAGAIARATGYVPQTLSGYYGTLSEAGLLLSRREGRSIIYRVNRERLTDLIAYLLEDCCGGQPDLCPSLFAAFSAGCAADDGSHH